MEEALARARADLVTAEATDDRNGIWSHLMHVAWLEESVGLHKQAIHHASRALEVAHELERPFETGRALCWLGWSYTSLGLYPLALELYGEAIDLATQGEQIEQPMVWGLATQETGALYARMGALDQARPLLELTTDYARRHGIDVGVAEGGAHLAAISLEQGDLGTAAALAEEAVIASERCMCSPYNTARARLVQAQVLLERARFDSKLLQSAIDEIESTLAFARSVDDRRHVAEALLLRSRTVPLSRLEERTRLVSEATQMLIEMDSELRGTAEAQLGSLFLESEQEELAELYLRSGLDVSQELFRSLDTAYIQADLGSLDAVSGAKRAALERWEAAATQAHESGALLLALHAETRLSDELYALDYTRLAQVWTESAIVSINTLLERLTDAAAQESLRARQLELSERLAAIRLDTGGPGRDRPRSPALRSR